MCLAESVSIEKAIERLRELREVYPKLHEITVLRGQAHQADESLQRLTALREQQRQQLAQKESALRQSRDKARTLENQIVQDEMKYREVSEHLRQTDLQMNP